VPLHLLMPASCAWSRFSRSRSWSGTGSPGLAGRSAQGSEQSLIDCPGAWRCPHLGGERIRWARGPSLAINFAERG
jgi:hypothetical protein